MKYIAIGFAILTTVLGALLFVTKEKLTVCQQVPDFRPAVTHVSKYVGYERAFHFYVECRGNDIFDDCKIQKPEDVTGTTVVLEPVREGQLGTSSYVVDWVEETIFYIDLSDENAWDINELDGVITFSAPPVQFDRVLRNKSYLPYIKDRQFGVDDEDRLLRLVKRTNEVSAQKVKEYLGEHRAAINGEMEKSLKEFVSKIISKMGYPNSYRIEVIFNNEA